MQRISTEARNIVREVRQKDQPQIAWNVVRPKNLSRVPPPAREWVVQDWLPIGAVTANYGDGGLGKTLAAQLLQTSCSAQIPWLGLAVMPCRSIGLYCEDDESELHRRQIQACDAFGLDMEDLGNMAWISGYAKDNLLAEVDPDDKILPTRALQTLEQIVNEDGAKLLVLDTAADLYPANENDRSKVRQFIGLLNRIAHRQGCAVLLNAHPSKDGLRSGNIDGGSTAWNNSVRSRWSLERASGEDADVNERILTRRKANYAATGTTLRVRWQNGVLVPVEAVTGLSALAEHARAETVFLNLLARFTADNRPVSDNNQASTFAPKNFAACPDRFKLSRKDFEGAMHRLFAAGKITMQEYGRVAGSGTRPRRIVATERSI